MDHQSVRRLNPSRVTGYGELLDVDDCPTASTPTTRWSDPLGVEVGSVDLGKDLTSGTSCGHTLTSGASISRGACRTSRTLDTLNTLRTRCSGRTSRTLDTLTTLRTRCSGRAGSTSGSSGTCVTCGSSQPGWALRTLRTSGALRTLGTLRTGRAYHGA